MGVAQGVSGSAGGLEALLWGDALEDSLLGNDVQGRRFSPAMQDRGARRFVQQREIRLADRREDNGETKVGESYQAGLPRLAAHDPPQDHG